MTPADLEILARQDDETLVGWALLLNSWGWPLGLPDEETQEEYAAFMLDHGGQGVRHSRRGQIMSWIEGKVGKRRILRAHNSRMSDEEFDDFWRGHYEGDEAARLRDEARIWWSVMVRVQGWQEALCDEESDFFDVFDVVTLPEPRRF